jgi:YidC/Oxa1 family membrane protein insertase
MEKRLLLAVVLMTAAIMFTNLVFPPPEPPVGPEVVETVVPAPAEGSVAPLPRTPAVVQAAATDSVVVASDLYRYVFGTRGAALLRAELLSYRSYRDPGGVVQLVPEGTRDFLTHRLVVGNDTVDLRALPFTASAQGLRIDDAAGGQDLEFSYEDESGFGVRLRYSFDPRGYLVSATGAVSGLGGRQARLLTELGPGW